MFHHVRLQLTFAYTLVAILFLVVMGWVMYEMITYYFQSTTDLALHHKMAHEYELLDLPLPSALALADTRWVELRQRVFPTSFGSATLPSAEQLDQERQVYEQRQESDQENYSIEEAYDGELAAIFLLPLDAQGKITALLGQPAPTAKSHSLPDAAAVANAQSTGSDLRTVRLEDGTRVRLLTYQLPANRQPVFFQLGRILTDQDLILRQLLLGLFVVGSLFAALSGIGGWWLAGRSLRPARQAFERQRRFVANASHELRTPLTLIRASTEYIQKYPMDYDERQALLNDVLTEVDHTTHLVDDLLLLSRLDAGRLALHKEPLDVAGLLGNVQRQIQRVAETNGVSVEVTKASGAVLGDPTRLRQVLLILLDNALHHTPHGGKVILNAESTRRFVSIQVCDTGTGIAKEHLPHLFDRFYRVDPARNQGGAGLGLSIAKSLIDAHQGQISIESELAEGTTVQIVLPAHT